MIKFLAANESQQAEAHRGGPRLKVWIWIDLKPAKPPKLVDVEIGMPSSSKSPSA